MISRHLASPIVVLVLLGTALIGRDRLAFRDVSHFYTPLYGYVAERTSEAWLPLWNPLDQTGISLLGETSTAVLYPIRYLVFSVPVATETAMAWYIALHLILASFAATWAAVRAGVSRQRAAIAGIVYPLSGSVLFLYCNPPFLVSAAWLPLVLGALISKRALSFRPRVVISAISLAMMVLGGDPQTAVHAVLVATVVCGCRGWFGGGTAYSFRQALCAIAGSALLAGLLATPQIAASVSWSVHSDRLHQDDDAAWYDPPPVGSARAEAYQFSLPPWHLAEIITPNAFGAVFPESRRVSKLVPGDGRVWTPTIYMGMLTAIALISQLARPRHKDNDSFVWMMIASGALLLSLGHFGLAYLVQQANLLGGVDSAIGGPYWWLHQCLPGYDTFRYPTKWLPVFSLAAAIVTAHWFDQTCIANRRRIPIACWAVAGVLIAAFASLLFHHLWMPAQGEDWPSELYCDSYWGPLNVQTAIVDIRNAVCVSMLTLAAIASIIKWLPDHSILNRTTAVVMVLATELGLSGSPLVLTVNRQDETRILQTDSANDLAAERWMRTTSDGGWPKVWSAQASPVRELEVAAAERAAWFGRWHLPHHVNVLNNMSSIRTQASSLFWDACGAAIGGMSQVQRNQHWANVRVWLNIDGVIQVDAKVNQHGQTPERDGYSLPTIRKQVVGTGLDHRLYTEWSTSAPQPSRSSMQTLVQSIQHSIADHQPSVGSPNGSRAGSARDQATLAEYSVHCVEPTLLVRPVFQDDHWHAELVYDNEVSAVQVVQVDYLKQGVVLPPGSWTIRFFYAPWWVMPSFVVGTVSWVGLLWIVIFSRKNVPEH